MDRIAIYLRLSKEDDVNRDESNSISNQRELIRQYIRKDRKLKRLEITELVDDGYSGKNLNRPQMQKLLELIKARQVSCVIVKDMSRFSRDYLTLGKYLEQIFPFMGIRFIAINDHYDSDRCEGGVSDIDVAFKALLYDFYSEDLSQKVKTSLSVRKEQGKFMSVYAPYGYRRCKHDRYMLEEEPEGAAVIRRIFSEYASGSSMPEIARGLNRDGIDTPAVYIMKRDEKNYFRYEMKEQEWSNYAVSRILRNETYHGTAVYNKAYNRILGSGGGGTYYPKEEWKRVEGAYPALVDDETYEIVRKKLETNKKWTKRFETHILTGKVYCGGCGYAMQHNYGGRPKYTCEHRFTRSKNEACITSVRDEDLEMILLGLIREKTGRRIGMQSILEEQAKAHREKVEIAKGHLRDMRESYQKIEADLFHAYEAYREGLTERETYIQQKGTYEEMLARLEEKQKLQCRAIEAMERESPMPEGWSPDSEYLQIEKLDRPLVELLVRKIIVYEDHTMDVIWNFKSED